MLNIVGGIVDNAQYGGNTISGNHGYGVEIVGTDTAYNTVGNNMIGLNSGGAAADQVIRSQHSPLALTEGGLCFSTQRRRRHRTPSLLPHTNFIL